MVWTDPVSLVTTQGISFDFFTMLLRYFSSHWLFQLDNVAYDIGFPHSEILEL